MKRVKATKSTVPNESWRGRIICDPGIHGGEPCIKGTRIPVAILVASLAEMSMEELLGEYPRLKREDLQASLSFAASSPTAEVCE